jgi:hypothetical protein
VSKPAAESRPEPTLIEGDMMFCWSEPHAVTVQENLPIGDLQAKMQRQWEAEVSQKYGPEFGIWKNKGSGGGECANVPLVLTPTCKASWEPCKPRPIDCKETPHSVGIAFDLSPGLDPDVRAGIAESVKSSLKERWQTEVNGRVGQEWGESYFNFETMRDRRPAEVACKEEDAGGGRVRYQCLAAATPCKKPANPSRR